MNKAVEWEKNNEIGDVYDFIWEKKIDFIKFRKRDFDVLQVTNKDGKYFLKKRVLDAGCGSGFKSILFSQVGAEVYSIDITNEDLHKNRPYKYFRQSVFDLGFKDNFFDYIYCDGVIHHTKNPEMALRELFRVLKQGGIIFLSVYRRCLINYVISVIRVLTKRIMKERLYNLFMRLTNNLIVSTALIDNLSVPIRFVYSEKQIRELLKYAGFRNMRLLKYPSFMNTSIALEAEKI